MTKDEVLVLIDGISKTKSFRPTESDCKFLEDLHFYVKLCDHKVTNDESKKLQFLYRKSQGG